MHQTRGLIKDDKQVGRKLWTNDLLIFFNPKSPSFTKNKKLLITCSPAMIDCNHFLLCVDSNVF